jgi:hypothetical protein
MRVGIAVLHGGGTHGCPAASWRYAVEVAGTPLGPGLSPSVATAGDVLVTRLDDEIVHRIAAARGATDAATA